MTTYTQAINNHYNQINLGVNIFTALKRAGKNVKTLTRDDIAPFDEFHIRGRQATRELARLAELWPGMKVLDLGCGIGGAARTLTAEFGCQVTGIDMVEEYCRTAQMLNLWVGQNNGLTIKRGNVLDMPFDNASFDVVWSQHMMMNIKNKARLFSEIWRVLKSNGRLVLYEICAGSAAPPHFPAPWASDESINFLLKPYALRQLLGEAGFKVLVWQDVTWLALGWFQQMIANMAHRPADASPPLGLNLLMGASTPDKLRNVKRNLEEDRIRVVQSVLELKI